ncbi:MAG: glycine/sarcosine/betaine reductase component B subunit [Lachnoclostridium sp.]
MRSSDWTAKLCKWLGVDGAIVSQEGFGNPDTDLIMNCKKDRGQGVKTVIITDEYAGRDGASQSLQMLMQQLMQLLQAETQTW